MLRGSGGIENEFNMRCAFDYDPQQRFHLKDVPLSCQLK